MLGVAFGPYRVFAHLGKPTPLFPVPTGGWSSNWTTTGDHTRFVVVEGAPAARQTFRVLTRWW